jgi:uncharacterized protein YlxW (UPF0749 family)
MRKTKTTEVRDVIEIFKNAEDTNYKLTCDVNDFEPTYQKLNQEICDLELDLENVKAQQEKAIMDKNDQDGKFDNDGFGETANVTDKNQDIHDLIQKIESTDTEIADYQMRKIESDQELSILK